MDRIGEGILLGMIIAFVIWFFVGLDFKRHGKQVYKELGLLPEKPQNKKPDRGQVRGEKIKIAEEVRAWKREAKEYHKRQEVAWENYIPPE